MMFFLVSGNVHGQTKKSESADAKKDSESEEHKSPKKPPFVIPTAKTKTNYTGDGIKAYLKGMMDTFKKSGKEPDTILSLNIKLYSDEIGRILEFEDLEYETEIYAAWYKKLNNAVIDLYKPKRAYEIAKYNNDTKALSAAEDAYKEALGKLREIITKPEHMTENDIKKATEEKKLRDLKKKKLPPAKKAQ